MQALRVAQRVPATWAEGPGQRYALWVQGCSLRCPGCCNPEMFAPERGEAVSIDQLVHEALASQSEGITLLGGEPFEQADGCAALASRVRAAGLSVMVFTGYRLDELPPESPLLSACDLLVDGRYERARSDTTRRWIGSTNQRLHFLSARYRPADSCFTEGNQLVIRLTRGELAVHGWPPAAARVSR